MSSCNVMVDGRSLIESFTSEMVGMISVPSCGCDRQSSSLSYSFPFRVTTLTRRRRHRQDVGLVRSYRELSRRITKEGVSGGLKCSVVSWGGAWEVERYLLDGVAESNL